MKKPKPLSDKLLLTHEGYHAYYLALSDYWQWRVSIAEEALKECQKWNVGEDNPPFIIASAALKLIEESEK